MSTYSVRKLGPGNEPVYTNSASDFLVDLDAVQQEIFTSLLLFQGEWWENSQVGTPWFQSILGNPASETALTAMSTALVNVILSVPYVLTATMQSIVFNPATRALAFVCYVTTEFGPLTVSNTGGNA